MATASGSRGPGLARHGHGPTARLLALALCFSLAGVAGAEAEPDVVSALTGGKLDGGLRWRYEHVEDDFAPGGVPLEDADASTLRAVLGYRTGSFSGFSAYVQGEAVVQIGPDDYFDGSNSKSRYATVVDPAGVELNEGYLAWESPASFLRLRGGRQEITYRPAPFHRFIGTILWRQNWQTFDAVSALLKPLANLDVNYAYVWQVNRIFGHDAPEPSSRFEGNSHFINAQYKGISWLALEGYAYLLDFDNAPRFSSDTIGVRASGAWPVNDRWSALYVAEYAHQVDAGDNTADYDADYLMLEGGVKVALGSVVKSLVLKGSYELLGGDGTPGGAFVSALGTNHPFQGWADRFLVTPDNGLQDLYFTVAADLPGNVKALVNYHDFNSDAGDYNYGDEWNIQATWDFSQRYQLGSKIAFYDGDPGPRNTGTPLAADVTKFWIWGQVKF